MPNSKILQVSRRNGRRIGQVVAGTVNVATLVTMGMANKMVRRIHRTTEITIWVVLKPHVFQMPIQGTVSS